MAYITYYAISVAITFALCSLVYKICLTGATFHRFNRIVILSIYAISFASPFIAPIYAYMTSPSDIADTAIMIEGGMPIVAEVVGTDASPGIWRFVPLIYSIGASVALVVTLIGLFRIVKVIRKGEQRRYEGMTLVVLDSDVSPFSWWKWVVVSSRDANNGMILKHELCHVRCLHTADLMLAQMFAVFNWFNPLAWIMRGELSSQHEYAVDDAMLRGGADAKSYQMLIVSKTVGLNMGPLANCLHNSQLKKRVKMMLKTKTKTMRGILAAAILPAAIAAMALIDTPAMATSVDKMSAATNHQEAPDTIHTSLDKVLVVGYGTMKKDTSDTLRFNRSNLSDAEIIIDGSRATEEQLKSLNPNSISDITVFKSPDRIIINTKNDKADVQMPEFKGGEGEIFRRLANVVRYPKEAMDAGAQGTAVVEFIVDPDGKANSFKIMRSTGNDALDAEAVRACTATLSSDWTPGKKNGEDVAVSYAVPVMFKLQELPQ